MEIFKRVLERTIAVERHRVASRTRRVCNKQIVHLEGMVNNLQAQLTRKDGDISTLETKVKSLDKEIHVKRDEVHKVEREMVAIRTALQDKDKHTVVLQKNLSALEEKFMKQKMLANTQQQLSTSKHEGDELSTQIWHLLEENCKVNKRILQLDMEVHSLEELLTRARHELEKAENTCKAVSKRAEVFRVGYEQKSRELVEISASERNLQASIINLNSELEQLKRNSTWTRNANTPRLTHVQIPTNTKDLPYAITSTTPISTPLEQAKIILKPTPMNSPVPNPTPFPSTRSQPTAARKSPPQYNDTLLPP